MITALMTALKTEQHEGNLHADQIVERIDRHITDLQTLRAWILDSAKVRSDAIETLIIGSPDAPGG